jgi:putative SOS response-associated peptidase YedK
LQTGKHLIERSFTGPRRAPDGPLYGHEINGKAKQPYAIAMRDHRAFAFAGLWENWRDPKTEVWIRAYTILTTKPNAVVAPLHDRMPVVLAPSDYNQLLDTSHDPAPLPRHSFPVPL